MVKKIYVILIIIILISLFLTACQEGFKEINIESGKIAFISSRNEQLELFAVDSYGSNLKKIIDSDQEIIDVAISSDLSYVILETADMVNNDLTGGGLYIYDLEKRKKNLIEEKGLYPSWSPKGDRFVYEKRTDDFKRLIILTDSQLNSKEVLIESKYAFPGISWSPDGKELLFFNSYLYHEIPYIDTLYRYIISEDKYVEIKLDKAYHLYNAAWSSVERVIAAGIYDPELKKDTLALIDPENGKVTHLTTLDHKLYLELDWSPDGRNILYTAYDISFYGFRGTWPWSNDNTDVYVYDIENDEIRNITNSEGTDYNPQWIP